MPRAIDILIVVVIVGPGLFGTAPIHSRDLYQMTAFTGPIGPSWVGMDPA
jgi:hypothetical protein